MKKITLLIAFFLALVTGSYAQVSSYGFSQSSGTYTEITGGTVLGTSTTATSFDSTLWAIPDGSIPFSFTYNNIAYTGCSVNSNGYITFGTTTSSAFTTTPISSATAYAGAISAWSGDLCGVYVAGVITGETRWEVVGTAPNREFVIQFKNWRPTYSSSTTNIPYMNFQIRLQETSNNVVVSYGANGYAVGSTAASGTRQIGLRGATNTDYNNRTNAAAVLFTASTSGVSNTASQAYNTLVATPGMPSNGLTYTWSPPTPCTGTPNGGAVTPANLVLSPTNLPGNIIGSGYSSGVTGLTFQWEESTDGGANYVNVVGGTGATTATYTPPAYAGTPILYRLKVTCSGSGLSGYSTPCSITSCAVVSSFPWTENFDSLATVGTTSFPTCWTKENGDWATTNNASATQDADARSGTQFLRDSWSATNEYIWTKGFQLTAGTSYDFSFFWAGDNLAGWTGDIFYNTSPNSSGATQMGGSFVTDATVTTKTYAEALRTFVPSTNGVYYFAIRVNCPTTTPWYLSFDDFKLDLTPACAQPTNLAASNITASTADVSWSAVIPTPTTGYEYVVSTSNVTPAGAGTPTTATTVNITSLAPVTSYYLFVRSDCSAGAFSTWAGPFPFTTQCSVYSVPATENFATFVPGCWQEADNGDLVAGPATFGASTWDVDGFGNVTSTGAFRYNIFTTGANDWVLSPLYAIPATGYELKFDAAATQFASQNAPTVPWESDDSIEVLVSNGTNNWTVLYTYNDSNQPTNTGSTNIINLDAFSGQNVRFAFRAIEGTTNGTADIDFSIDNFEIRLTPACPGITGLAIANLGDSSADISWNLTTGNYQYVLDQIATDPAGAGTDQSGEVYYATSLTPQTQYYFHVRTDCGGSLYGAWSTIAFTTPAPPPANDDCVSATVLTPAGSFAAGAITSSMLGATNSAVGDPTIPAPGCASYVGGDVWFSASVPASGTLTFETGQETGGFTDSGLAVYSGTCTPSGLTLILCNDDIASPTNNFSRVAVTGRTPGEILLARAWKYNSATARDINAIGEFKIAAWDASLGRDSFDLNGFKAYPNPVKDILNLSYTKQISNVSVHNILGQEVLNVKVNDLESKINMSELSNGTYLVKVTVDGLTNTLKVIKE